ncbi:MAG: hypothetical protein ACOH15_06440 [Acetobacterium sp.]
MKDVIIREIKQTAIPLLSDFLSEAIFQRDEQNWRLRDVIGQPEIQVHIENFGRKDDHCLVAIIQLVFHTLQKYVWQH